MTVVGVPISGLPQGALPLSLTDTVPIVQGGVTKRIQVRDLLNTPPIAPVNFSGDHTLVIADTQDALVLQSTGAGLSRLLINADTGNPLTDIPIGAVCDLERTGSGALQVVGLGAVTFLPSPNTQFARIQGSLISVRKHGPNAYTIGGDAAAVSS